MSYGLFSTSQVAPSMTRFCKKLSMKKNVIPPTQARDSQTLPRVVPRAHGLEVGQTLRVVQIGGNDTTDIGHRPKSLRVESY